MAATKASDGDKKKKAKGVTVRVKVKSDKKPGKKASGEKKAKKTKKLDESFHFDGIAKLLEQPIVADLLAAGALAAVTAIADRKIGDKGSGARAFKSAGKAAAAAMGTKLMAEFGAIKDAATTAAKKA